MKEWEVRMKHHRDLVDSQCESLGIDPPKHPPGGVNMGNQDLWRQFKGPAVTQAMKKRGHDSLNYDSCKCAQHVTHERMTLVRR